MTRLGHQAVRPPAPRQYAYPGAAAAAAEKTETTETEDDPGPAAAAEETTEEKTACMSAHPVGALVHFRVVIQQSQQRFGQNTLE